VDIGQVTGFAVAICAALVAAIGTLATAIAFLYRANERIRDQQVQQVQQVTTALTVSSASLDRASTAMTAVADSVQRQTDANTVEHKQMGELLKVQRRAMRASATRKRAEGQ